MRPIKFRAWLNREEYYTVRGMFEVYRLGQEFSELVIVGLIEGVANKYLNLMQFTGLLDKNGKEIYEGDIVKIGKVISEVVFDGGCFKFNTNACWKTLKDVYVYQCISQLISLETEVIGNIYENPELLEER